MVIYGPTGTQKRWKPHGVLRAFSVSLTLMLAGLQAHAMSPELVRSDDKNLFVLQLENDAFAAQDDGYTNGFRATVIPGTIQAPAWLRRGADWLTPLSADKTGPRSPWSWSISQTMFTPSEIADPAFPPDDRAYAGWLQASASLFTLTETELERFRVSVGTVGPASGAEQAQKQVHEALGAERPVGWDRQLPNEPTLQFSYDRQWRMIRDGSGLVVEATPTFGTTLGNARAGVEAGGFVRIGDNIPVDFGPQRINSLAGGTGYYKPTRGFGWYLYAGVAAHYAPHIIFLDGSLTQSTPGIEVERDPYFGQAYAGFACYHGPARIGLVMLNETDRFETQSRSGRFGALTISWRI